MEKLLVDVANLATCCNDDDDDDDDVLLDVGDPARMLC